MSDELHYENMSLEDIPGETWVVYPEFGEKYLVSDLGRVKAIEFISKKGKLHPSRIVPQHFGHYLAVGLYYDGKSANKTVHRLVGICHIPNPENKKEVNHLFGNKYDARKVSLEWATPSENQKHSFRIGLNKVPGGEDNLFSKLTNKQVLEIFNSKGTQASIAKKYKIDKSIIGHIKSGFKWSSVTGMVYKRKRLTEKDVINIYKSKKSDQSLAEQYGQPKIKIWRIRSGYTWAWLTGQEYIKAHSRKCKKKNF